VPTPEGPTLKRKKTMNEHDVLIEALAVVYTIMTVTAANEEAAEAAALRQCQTLPPDAWELDCPIPGIDHFEGVVEPLVLGVSCADGDIQPGPEIAAEPEFTLCVEFVKGKRNVLAGLAGAYAVCPMYETGDTEVVDLGFDSLESRDAAVAALSTIEDVLTVGPGTPQLTNDVLSRWVQ
jgi:hypothetical protein